MVFSKTCRCFFANGQFDIVEEKLFAVTLGRIYKKVSISGASSPDA